MSAGVRGFRVGTGPRGPYVAGGRGGIYFRQNLRQRGRSTRPASHTGNAGKTDNTYILVANVPSDAQPGESSTTDTIETPFVPRRYPPVLLIIMLVLSLLPWITSGFPQTGILGAINNVVIGLLLLDLVVAMVLDWRGFTTLNGRLHWSRHGSLWKITMGSVYVVFFMIMLPVYLVFALKDQRTAYDYARLEQQRHIAELESEMGMTPPTEGTCPHCHKPLQLGAEFCAYCGARAVARPRVCPVCATTTLPDAKWCPHCGTSLDDAPAPGVN
jgi:RNA polymerase subunit RPABC4/transcription elongation factor Spt4